MIAAVLHLAAVCPVLHIAEPELLSFAGPMPAPCRASWASLHPRAHKPGKAVSWSQVGHEAAEDKLTTRPNLGPREKKEISMVPKMSPIIQVSPTIQEILTHSPDGKKLTVLLICVEG